MTSSVARKYRGLALAVVAVAIVAPAAQGLSVPAAPASPDEVGSGSGLTAPVAAAGTPEPAAPPAPARVDGARTGAITPTPATEEVSSGERGVTRARTVAVDPGVLPTDTADDVALPLFDDTTVVAELDAPSVRSEGGYQTWSGTVAGHESSTVVLVEQDGAVSGYVNTTETAYRLVPMPDGSTRIEEIDPTDFPDEHPHPTAPAGPTVDGHGHEHPAGTAPHTHEEPVGAAAGRPAAAAGPDDAASTSSEDAPQVAAASADAPVIDLLVAYTSAAKARNGGQAAMDGDIALMIEQTNAAFATSGIDATVRLAHSVEVATNGPASQTTLYRLSDRGDGYYDDLHVLRNEHAADLVSLIVDSPGGPYCGIAFLPQGISTAYESQGFSVNDAICATRHLVFTHELGHNFGAAHDRGAWSGRPPLPYGYDWVNPAQQWKTVMSYSNACSPCRTLLRFSNPDQTYGGAPLGAPIGAPNAADNRAVLNTTASTIASFRGAPATASLTLTGRTGGASVPATGTVVTTWSTSGYLGSDAKVELLRGEAVAAVLTGRVALGTGRFAAVLPSSTVRGGGYRIRVTPLDGPQYAQATDEFTVIDPAIAPTHTLTSVAPGGTGRVSWTYTGAPTGTVKVELVKDGRTIATLATSAPLGSGGAGGVDVTLPAALNDGGGYQVRTTLSAAPRSPALSDGFALASSRRLVVTSPANGVTHRAGAPLTVAWTAAGDLGPSVKAELVKGDVVVATSLLVATTAGRLTLTPPAKLPTGEDYRVRLLSHSLPTVVAAGAGGFSLDGTALAVTSQSQPGTVVAGRPLPVTWTAVGTPGTAVKVEAVAPDLAPVVIAPSAPLAAGSFTWTVPLSLPRADWRVRATVVGNTLVTSTSAAATTVTWPTLSASGPAAVVAGAPATVSWAFSDAAAAPVRVRMMQGSRAVATLTTNGVTAADGTGSLTYRLPITLAPGTYAFDVAPVANLTLVAASGNATLTRPSLSITAPTSVVAGAPATVSWAFTDSAAAPVRVRLMRSNTVVATLTSTGATAADGTGSATFRLPITVPPMPAGVTSYQFLVDVPALPGLYRFSPLVAVSAPTLTAGGATTVARGQSATISWAFSNGALAPVKVQLVQGSTVVAVASSAVTAADSTGTVTWKAPTTVAPGLYTLRIRPALLATSAYIEGSRAFTVT